MSPPYDEQRMQEGFRQHLPLFWELAAETGSRLMKACLDKATPDLRMRHTIWGHSTGLTEHKQVGIADLTQPLETHYENRQI